MLMAGIFSSASRSLTLQKYSRYLTRTLRVQSCGVGLLTTSRTVDGRHVIRTVAIECDKNGEASLAKVHEAVAAGIVPPPTLVIRSSTPPPGVDGFAKYHFWWAVKDFTLEQQEAMNSALQQAFGGDIAAKDTVRVLRLAGFANQKRKYPHKPVATIVESSAGAIRSVSSSCHST